MKKTGERIFEYASMPVHGTMSRKLRKGVSLQINEEKIYALACPRYGSTFSSAPDPQKRVFFR